MNSYVLLCIIFGFYTVFASVNLSLKKHTSQTSVFKNGNQNLTSDRAVDGNYDLVPDALSCAVTQAKDKEVFWQVDLGEMAMISHIHFVFEKTSKIIAILRNHRVFISNQTSLQSGSKRECFRETRHTPPLINEVHCQTVGRFVTYFSNQLFDGEVALLLICEVEVYGCRVGAYGHQCLNECSSNCETQPCEPDLGHCIGSCKPGFTGARCDRVCPTGFYGPNCALTCSINCAKDDCINTNGTCRRCIDGFTGDMCDTAMNSDPNTGPDTNTPAMDQSVMDGVDRRDTIIYFIIIAALAVIIVVSAIVITWYRIKLKNMEKKSSSNSFKMMTSKNGSIYQTQTQAKENLAYQSHGGDGNYQDPELSVISTKSNSSTAMYDLPGQTYDGQHYIDAKSKKDTLSYENRHFSADPSLNYEALQRDGIYPRESKHIYDPIQNSMN